LQLSLIILIGLYHGLFETLPLGNISRRIVCWEHDCKGRLLPPRPSTALDEGLEVGWFVIAHDDATGTNVNTFFENVCGYDEVLAAAAEIIQRIAL
jgi:hypothetical protein